VVAVDEGLRVGLVASAFLLGLRHGVDWDHLAAIGDLAGAADTRRRAFASATLYIGGHALVVLILGLAAVVVSREVPPSVDVVMGRVVGATLLALGAYVIVGLLRSGRDFRMRSRWTLVADGVRRVRSRSGHDHTPSTPAPAVAAFGVGMLHGVGAETPTQVLVFLAAAGVAGTAAGVIVLVCFVAGLFVSNTAIAMTAAGGFLRPSHHFPVYASVASLAAMSSLVVGALLVLDRSDVLPPLLGG